MKANFTFYAVWLAWFTLAATGHAQGLGGGLQQGLGPLEKLFGVNLSFSGTCFVSLKDESGTEKMSMEITILRLDQKMRTEIDMAKMKNAQINEAALAQVKTMGMDRMITILRGDENLSYSIYPTLKAYVSSPIPKADAVPPGETPKIEKTDLAKETIDGHPCDKKKVVITMKDGKTFEALVWEATDLNNFPIQSQFSTGGNTMTNLFKNIKFDKPAAALFEPPADFKKYSDMQEMMGEILRKQFGGGK